MLAALASGVLGQSGNQALSIGQNRIEGRVTDASGTGVYNAYVELYSDLGSLINRSRTSGSGTFSFRGMGPGRYTVRVKPYGTNLLEGSRDLEVNNQYSRSDMVYVDIRLEIDNRFASPEPSLLGVVFVQDIPKDAKRSYDAGTREMDTGRETAIRDLEQAIKLFPTYFDALRALGRAHIAGGQFEKGYPYLLRAIDVNRRCADCYYSLGIAFYRLEQIPAAMKAVDAAALLSPGSPGVHLLRGIVYRTNGDLSTALKALETARSLSKPLDPEILWQLSLVYNRLGRNEDAAKELEEYLKVNHQLDDKQKENVKDLIRKMRTPK